MADSGHHRKRKSNLMEGKNWLSVGENVEVRSIEDGFQGSWHAGVIIGRRGLIREVRYDNLLLDDESDYLVDCVEVSRVVDGNFSRSEVCNSCYGRIRPLPPYRKPLQHSLHYGLCVDVYHNEAWWEGVIFDREEGSVSRKIFFPDLGDEMNAELKVLRVSQDWDEVTAEWKLRGNWLFLEIIKELERDIIISVSIKQIWYDVRERRKLDHIGHWASPAKPLWKKLIEEVIHSNLGQSIDEFVNSLDFLEPMSANVETIPALESTPICEQNFLSPMSTFDDYVANGQHKSPELSIYSHTEGISFDSEEKPEECSWSRRNSSLEIYVGEKCEKWQPANDIFNLKPEFLPECIDEYLLSLSKTRRPANHFTNRVRNHLLYMGWKISYAVVSRIVRVRYTSPEGKHYSHLRLLLHENFGKSATRTTPQTVKRSQGRMLPPSHDGMTYLAPVSEQRSSHVEEKIVIATPKSNDLSFEPKFCPDVIFKYLNHSKNSHRIKSGKSQSYLVELARKHLQALGWSFWFKDKHGRGEWRYDSPTTGKTYYSLKSACQAIANGSEMNMSSTSTFSQHEDGMSGEKSKDESAGEVPLGKTYFPLRSSCQAIANGRELNTSSPSTFSLLEDGMSREEPKVQSAGEVSLCNTEAQDDFFPQWFEKSSMPWNIRALRIRKHRQRKTNDFGRPLAQLPLEEGRSTNRSSSTSDGNNSIRVLRSSKRIRKAGPITSCQIPRTLLSWLIDNGVVLPRDKVQYRNKRSIKPMAEGRINREGIKCSCCQKVFTLSGFEAHAGSGCHRPSANIFLEDGRSLLECQMQMLNQNPSFCSKQPDKVVVKNCQSWNDQICSVCHYGGELILCDQCPSSFHASCLNLQGIPEGDWFCPLCCCGICGESKFDLDTGHFIDNSILCCHQCERQFHASCIRQREMVMMDVRPKENWFCSKACEKVHWGLQQLLGKAILVGHNNLTWTLIRHSIYNPGNDNNCDVDHVVTVADNYSKLSVALEVMHECFEPVKEPQTKRDLVDDVIFSRRSNLKRLNFRGFYTVLLERNDELITVAALRVYGTKVAEIPFIGTRFQHRHQGMCRILMNEIEKNLMELGVERLVLPAARSVLNTWITSFGFSQMSQSERSELLGYTFLDFQDTVMCQRLLIKPPSPLSLILADAAGVQQEHHLNTKGSNTHLDNEGNSSISDVFLEDRVEGSETVNQRAQLNVHNGDPRVSEPCISIGSIDRKRLKRLERDKWEGSLKFYKRKKAAVTVSQRKYPNVEVSCR